MDQQNPYQSPQVTEPEPIIITPVRELLTIEDKLGPDWLKVCIGAKNCYTSVKFIIIAVFAYFLYLFIVPTFEIDKVKAGTSFGAAIMAPIVGAWYFHFIGLIRLRKTSKQSNAKGLFTAALVTFFLINATLLLMIFFLGLRQRRSEDFEVLFFMITTLIIGFTMYVVHIYSLIVGIRRIGLILQDNKIIAYSIMALYLSLAMHSILVLTWFIEYAIVVVHIIGNALAIGSYGIALKKIADYAKSPAEDTAS